MKSLDLKSLNLRLPSIFNIDSVCRLYLPADKNILTQAKKKNARHTTDEDVCRNYKVFADEKLLLQGLTYFYDDNANDIVLSSSSDSDDD